MNNSRPALRASRIFYLPPDNHKVQDIPQRPGPNVRVSPLIQPRGESGEIELRDCTTCANRADCMKSVMRNGPFALEVCEMQTSKRKYELSGEHTGKGIKRRNDRAAILHAIRARKSFCVYDIHKDTGLHNSTINGHLSHLMALGMIRRIGRSDAIGTPIMYELVEDA